MPLNERQVFIMVAAKRHGKSTTVRVLAEKMASNILVFKEGVNLYDKAYDGYAIQPLGKYTGGKAIIDGGQIEYANFLDNCSKYFRNGVIVIDDAAIYEENIMSKPLKKILVSCRRLGIDVILVFHSMEDIPIKIFTYTDVIIMGYSTGNFEYKLRKLPAGHEIIEASDYVRNIARSCRCESQKPCKCGKRYVRRIIKLT